MDEFLKELARFGDITDAFTVVDVAIVLLLSFGLSLAIAWNYKFTHRGISYSQSFAQTLVLMGVVVALVMLIIGSNIARAFALVGALSIIRFRNAVKESRDVAFVFVAMAVGMACGTRFYMLAAFSTLALIAFNTIVVKLDLFAREVRERILRVQLPPGMDHAALLGPVFERYVAQFALVSVETLKDGELQELVYSIRLGRKVDDQVVLDEIRKLTGGAKVSLVTGFQEIDL